METRPTSSASTPYGAPPVYGTAASQNETPAKQDPAGSSPTKKDERSFPEVLADTMLKGSAPTPEQANMVDDLVWRQKLEILMRMGVGLFTLTRPSVTMAEAITAYKRNSPPEAKPEN